MNAPRTTPIILSTFPGLDLLGQGFELEGFCVVRTGDPAFGQLGVEYCHPPAGVFQGVLGGPPCQRYSKARSREDRATWPNLIPEFERVVSEAQPDWFLMENVVPAPVPKVAGYEVQTQTIHAEEFGVKQRRPRRFSFGVRAGRPILMMWPRGQRGSQHFTYTTKPTTRYRRDGQRYNDGKNLSVDQYKEAFGLPPQWSAPVLNQNGVYRILGNSVPLPVALQLAIAVKRATGQTDVVSRHDSRNGLDHPLSSGDSLTDVGVS